MKYEYLLFNMLVLAGPVIFSFDDTVRFVSKWPQAAKAVGIALVPFVFWDFLVVQRHWWFNPRFTTGLEVAGLPVEEILFFFSVPFACLFVWEAFFTHRRIPAAFTYPIPEMLTATGLLAGVLFLLIGHHYTGIVLLAFGSVLGLDQILRIRLLHERQTYHYLGIVTLFILMFNGYLTARPLVLYDESYLLGLRIFTIPVEDFVYGYTLILLSVILYEKFRRRRYV